MERHGWLRESDVTEALTYTMNIPNGLLASPLSNTMNASTLCDLCDGTDFLPLITKPMVTGHAREGLKRHGRNITTVLCRRCGLAFHHPPVTDADREAAGLSFSDLHINEPLITPRLIAKTERRAQRQWDFIRPVVKPGMEVLDVGCYIGALAKRFQDAGAHVLGIEPDATVAEFARQHYGLEVWDEMFESVELGDRQFDFIVISHVIEHVISPAAVLRKLRAHLKQGGTIFLATPNLVRPKTGPWRLFSAAHNFYFTPKTLGWEMEKCGLRPTRVCEYLHEEFMMLGQAGEAREPRLDPLYASQVLRAIKSHRRNYRLQLMFVTRKIPVLQNWWYYRKREYTW